MHAPVAHRGPAVALVAELAAFDLPPAVRARQDRSLLRHRVARAHHGEASLRWWTSIAALSASSLSRSPTSRPSDVVMGEFIRPCAPMNSAISRIGTWGRNVLGRAAWPARRADRHRPAAPSNEAGRAPRIHRSRRRMRPIRWGGRAPGRRRADRSAGTWERRGEPHPLRGGAPRSFPRSEARRRANPACPQRSRRRRGSRTLRAATRLVGSGLRPSPSSRRPPACPGPAGPSHPSRSSAAAG